MKYLYDGLHAEIHSLPVSLDVYIHILLEGLSRPEENDY